MEGDTLGKEKENLSHVNDDLDEEDLNDDGEGSDGQAMVSNTDIFKDGEYSSPACLYPGTEPQFRLLTVNSIILC